MPKSPRLLKTTFQQHLLTLSGLIQDWSTIYCAVGATFWTATNEEERSMAKKEFRRGSIRRVLSRIRGSDQGPPFELFRDCTDVSECSKWVRATSGSSSDLFVWCVMKPFNIFFFWADLWTTKVEFSVTKRENERPKKWYATSMSIESVKLRSKTQARRVCKGFTHEVLYLQY